MKPSVLVLMLVVVLLALGAFLLIGVTKHDDTDQLEQNQPTQTPSSTSNP